MTRQPITRSNNPSPNSEITLTLRSAEQVTASSSSSAVTLIVLPLKLSQDMVKSDIRRTYDLLAKYKNKEDLLDAIELMKGDFENVEITVPHLILDNFTEENVGKQLQQLGEAIVESM